MVTKDWILLIVPIIFNGIFVLIIQLVFENKKLKRETKMPCYKNFSKLLKNLNETFIQENIDIQIKSRDVNESLKLFGELIIEIVKYYDSNKLYLSKISQYYELFIASWDSFMNATQIVNNPLTISDKHELGKKIQTVKNDLDNLNLKLDNLILKI